MREFGIHADDEVLLVDVAQTHEGVFAVDEDRRIVFWNEGAQALLGYAAADVLGGTCCDILGEDCACALTHPRAQTALMHSGAPGRIVRTAATAVTRDGALRHLRVLTLVARNAQGRPRAVHLLRDLDESAREFAQLSQTIVGRDPTAAEDDGGASGRRRAVEQPPAPPHASTPPHASATPAPHLTPREREVLRLLASGLSTADIAATLSISPITARNHVTSLIEKLEVKTRLQAVVVAARRGLL